MWLSNLGLALKVHGRDGAINGPWSAFSVEATQGCGRCQVGPRSIAAYVGDRVEASASGRPGIMLMETLLDKGDNRGRFSTSRYLFRLRRSAPRRGLLG